jgi:hypothetical protein
MNLKKDAPIALLAYQLLKDLQKEKIEIRSSAMQLVDQSLSLDGDSIREKLKGLRYGIELYYFLIHKGKNIPWKAIELNQSQFEKLRGNSPNEYSDFKLTRDDYKSYQSNRIADLAKNYEFESSAIKSKNFNELISLLDPFITRTRTKLIADLKFINETDLISSIAEIKFTEIK